MFVTFVKIPKTNKTMRTLRIIGTALIAVLLCLNFAACSSDDDEPEKKKEKKEAINPRTGIATDAVAGKAPDVNDENKTFDMPTSISPISVDPDNKEIGRFSLAGINANGEWLELYGTGEKEQNVWLEIGGVQKGVKIYNGEDVATRAISKAKADVVFLVDNSGSMSEEADKIAEEIIRWSQVLSQTMDVQFGCVGIDHYDINGALNITDANTLSTYLNSPRYSWGGTSRTQHYGQYMETPPADWEELQRKANEGYTNAGGECGGIMLHFADENFAFREGANRFYVYFTDESNQPGGNGKWSVLSVNKEMADNEYYNWDSSKGVIYTVFSDEYSTPENWENWLYNENPYLFSTYTGGTTLSTSGDFEISLDDLPVTGAITQSFIFAFNITEDLKVGGVYDVVITIYYPDGSIASTYTYENIKFVEG